MRTAKITCPYCSNSQKIFYFSFNLKQFFNIFSKQEQLIPTRAITDINKQIKKFSCKACLKDLIYFFNINNEEYLVVATRAKAIEGQANQAIIVLLAQVLNLKKHQIEIISGFKSRYKVIKLDT
mgnify:CR=1 FL=1